jgi:hypothetical protein
MQIGDDGPVFTVDVIAVHNAWILTDKAFRNEANEVAPERFAEWDKAAYEFVRDWMIATVCEQVIQSDTHRDELLRNNAPLAKAVGTLSLAECREFLAVITREVLALRPFFETKLPGDSSSPEKVDLTFST